VLLTLGLFVGFNITNIVVAFTYLSLASIPERTDGDEDEVLEPQELNALNLAVMLFFVVFGDRVVRRIEGSETSRWFWLFSDRREVLVVFGVLCARAIAVKMIADSG
jgi:hypothetical protein